MEVHLHTSYHSLVGGPSNPSSVTKSGGEFRCVGDLTSRDWGSHQECGRLKSDVFLFQ